MTSEQELRQEQYGAWTQSLAASRPYGPGDRLGSLNLLTPEARGRGKSAIRSGDTVSLSRPLNAGPTARHDGHSAFDVELYTELRDRDGGFGLASEHLDLDCHGPVNTHIDALNHLGYHGHWYNGAPLGERNDDDTSITDFADLGIFARALHVDIPALRRTGWVAPQDPVTGDEIERAFAGSGVTFQTGDALLIDSGRDRFEAEHGPWSEATLKGGVGSTAAEWLADNRVSLLLWDMMDAMDDTHVRGSIHQLHWAIGMVLVDNCDFGRARTILAERRQFEAALAISPLPIPQGTGCNVNPLLIL
jgi:hypothetical protein